MINEFDYHFMLRDICYFVPFLVTVIIGSVESLPTQESACPRVVPELDCAGLWAEYRILPKLHAVKFLLR